MSVRLVNPFPRVAGRKVGLTRAFHSIAEAKAIRLKYRVVRILYGDSLFWRCTCSGTLASGRSPVFGRRRAGQAKTLPPICTGPLNARAQRRPVVRSDCRSMNPSTSGAAHSIFGTALPFPPKAGEHVVGVPANCDDCVSGIYDSSTIPSIAPFVVEDPHLTSANKREEPSAQFEIVWECPIEIQTTQARLASRVSVSRLCRGGGRSAGCTLHDRRGGSEGHRVSSFHELKIFTRGFGGKAFKPSRPVFS